MDNSLLAVRDINHKYIVVDRKIWHTARICPQKKHNISAVPFLYILFI